MKNPDKYGTLKAKSVQWNHYVFSHDNAKVWLSNWQEVSWMASLGQLVFELKELTAEQTVGLRVYVCWNTSTE